MGFYSDKKLSATKSSHRGPSCNTEKAGCLLSQQIQKSCGSRPHDFNYFPKCCLLTLQAHTLSTRPSTTLSLWSPHWMPAARGHACPFSPKSGDTCPSYSLLCPLVQHETHEPSKQVKPKDVDQTEGQMSQRRHSEPKKDAGDEEEQ